MIGSSFVDIVIYLVKVSPISFNFAKITTRDVNGNIKHIQIAIQHIQTL